MLVLFVGLLVSQCHKDASTAYAFEIDFQQRIEDILPNIERTEMVESTEEMVQQPLLAEITDLSDAYEVILRHASQNFIAGYCLDDAFLMWLTAEFGEESLMQLAYTVLDTEQDINTWYEVTGNSIHVLWLMYCRDTGFKQDALSNVIWTDCKSDEETIISFTGDFNLAEDWHTTLYLNEQQNGISDCLSPELIQILQDSDILMVNNEFVYSDSNTPLEGKAYTFRADLERVSILKELGTDLVSLANNHTYDYGEEGLLDTMEVLKEANIAFIGAGENIEAAKKIVYYVANGKKIAFVSATEIERTKNYTKEATEDSPGVLKALNPKKFIGVIEAARKNSDYVVAIPHWGTEGNLYPDNSQLRQTRLYAQAGADVIIGGHPHRLQGAGFVEGIPVAYSLGNFWFSTGTLYTTVAQVVIEKEGALQLKFVPCLQKDLTTGLITDKTEKDGFYHYIAAISSGIGIDAEGNVYDKKLLEESYVFPYDSDSSQTAVRGGVDNEGFLIDIVGNRKEVPMAETELSTETETQIETGISTEMSVETEALLEDITEQGTQMP